MEIILAKLSQLDQRFDKLNSDIGKRFESIDKRFDAVDKRFDGINSQFESIDKRFDGVDKKLADHDDQFDRVIDKLINHDGRIEKIERTMATKEDLRKITDTLDYLLKISLEMRQELIMTNNALGRHEDRIEHLEKFEKRAIKINPSFRVD